MNLSVVLEPICRDSSLALAAAPGFASLNASWRSQSNCSHMSAHERVFIAHVAQGPAVPPFMRDSMKVI